MYPEGKLRRKSEINESQSLSDLNDCSYLGFYNSIRYFLSKNLLFFNNFAVFVTYAVTTYVYIHLT